MILEISAAAVAGSLVGFFSCAVLTAGKVADLTDERNQPLIDASAAIEQSRELDAAHQRATDALQAKTDRIERVLACETPNAAHGVKKMARILRGDA